MDAERAYIELGNGMGVLKIGPMVPVVACGGPSFSPLPSMLHLMHLKQDFDLGSDDDWYSIWIVALTLNYNFH